MRLISCYIENFGRLSQFAMDFTEGLNTIQAENGWGKSTLSAFLKAMFFGLEYSPKKKLTGNERRRFSPWQGGNYGGNVIFSHKDKTYKIERFFGAKDKDDTFRLYDMASGLECFDYTENIGEEIFEVDRDSFAMSVYFPQNQLPVSMSDSLNAKINDLDAFGGDIDRYEAAMELLETRLKEYKKTGNRGLLGEWEERIAWLHQKVEEGQQKEDIFEERKHQLDVLQSEIHAGEKQLEVLRHQQMAAEEEKTRQVSNEHLKHLREQVEKDSRKLKPLKDFFKGGIPSDEDIEQLIHLEEKKRDLEHFPSQELLEQSRKQVEKDRKLLEEIRQEAGNKIPDEHTFMSIKELADSLKAYERRSQKKLAAYTVIRKEQQKQQQTHVGGEKKTKDMLLYVLGGVVALAFLLCAVFFPSLRILSVALCLVVLLLLGGCRLGIIGHRARMEASEIDDTAEQLQEELERLQEGIHRQQERLSAALVPFGLRPEEEPGQRFEYLQLLYTRYTEQEARLISGQKKCEKLEKAEQEFKIYQARELSIAQKEKKAFSEKYGMNLSFWNLRTLLEIKERKHEYEHLLAEYQEHKKQLDAFLTTHAQSKAEKESLTDRAEVSKEEIVAAMERLQREQAQRIRTRESYRRDMELLTTQIEEVEDYRQEGERLKETYEEGRRQAELLQKTMKYLKEAKERFSTRYMDKMREGFDKYMRYIDADGAHRLCLDASLKVREDAQGSLHEDAYLSTGLLEFAGICTRLALVEAMYEGEKPFLILDDPFVNLDEEKVKKGMALLQELSKTYQILYFTCHSSRA